MARLVGETIERTEAKKKERKRNKPAEAIENK